MITIARTAALSLAAAGILLSSHTIAQDEASDGAITTDTHRFQPLADGVYLAMYTVPMFNSNSLVVINDDDVLVVDSHITPNAARELISGIGQITDKPITTLVYTHFHYDHAHGTQAFPEVQIIGHEFTRETMAGDPHNEPTFQREKAGQPRTIAWLESQLESASDEQREQLEYRLGLARAHAESTKTIEPVPPDTTLNDRLTLFRGDREIQVIFCGRAHTGGDVVIYLPADKIAYTGDMAFRGPSFLGDGHVDEWPDTLMRLKELDVELYVPGHGPPFTDSGRLDLVADFYRDLWDQVVTARADGANAGEATARVDLTSYADSLGPQRTDPLAVARIYQLLDQRGD